MKKLVLGAVGLAALTATSFAADMPAKAPPAAVVASNWSGVYGGMGVGWMRSEVDWHYTNPGPATLQPFTNSVDDAFFSGLAGVQYQFGNIVLGVEASAGTTVGGRWGGTPGGSATGPCTSFVQVCQTKLSNILTAGGRLGFAFNDWLIYGSGGWARGSIRSQVVNALTGVVVDADQSAHHDGWYAGGGVEYIVVKGGAVDVIAGIDYKHIDLETRYHSASPDVIPFGPSPPGFNGRNLSATADIVQVRLIAKINGWPWLQGLGRI